MADQRFITNRRQLLIGLGASTVTGSAVPAKASIGTGDPAYPAFLDAEDAADRLNRYRGPEDVHFDGLYGAYIAAERRLATTSATSLLGLYGKMRRLIAMTGWETEQYDIEAAMACSVLKDLDGMTRPSR